VKLTQSERRRWEEFAGKRFDPYCDAPVEEISVDDYGCLHVGSTVSCGVYVVINADDDVMYVGKVCRVTGTVDDRFRRHHAAADEWDRVWVLPMRETADPRPVEDSMIEYFDPPDNKASKPCR
jgi:hypothetical protein